MVAMEQVQALTVEVDKHCIVVPMSLFHLKFLAYIRARLFILAIPGCPSCSSVNTAYRKFGGTITLFPHSMHPSYSDSSTFLEKYGLSSSSGQSAGHLFCKYCTTVDNFPSFAVAALICLELTGELSKCSVSSTSSGGELSTGDSSGSGGSSGSGSQLRASALQCSLVPRNFMVNLNLDKYRDHLRTRADACGDDAGLSSPNNLSNGL